MNKGMTDISFRHTKDDIFDVYSSFYLATKVALAQKTNKWEYQSEVFLRLDRIIHRMTRFLISK